MKKKIIVLICSLILISLITFIGGLNFNIQNSMIKITVNIFFNLLNGLVALIAMKLTNVKLDLDFKNKKQYLIGISISLILSLLIAVIPALFGISLVGNHTDFSIGKILFNLLYYVLVIGIVEELVFRVYLQETFINILGKNKWIAVIISSLIFGLWHLINGSLLQVAFTFGIGLVFGFCKYLIKDCKYLGLALGHGLYDFFNVIVRMFII